MKGKDKEIDMFEEKITLLSESKLCSAEEKVKLILEEAKKIKQKAEEGADRIIEEARKKASELIETNGSVESNLKTGEKNKKLKYFAGKSNAKKWKNPGSRICPKDIFHIILERERTRSDRNGHELSLILFDSGEDKKVKLNFLIKSLMSRARSVDRFGWCNEKFIGVVLPNTHYKRGLKFAHGICGMILINNDTPPDFKVYSYPQKWLQPASGLNIRKHTAKDPENRELAEDTGSIFIKEMPFWKRCFDILGSITALIIFSPFFILTPLIIKIVSSGPIFFKQERVGQGGRPFSFLKFRTMKINNDSTSHQNYLNELIKSDRPMTKLDKEQDPRIIPFGKFIRKACIDELPQLINVLKGDMSLTGPRPCLPYEAEEYLKWHRYRFDIKPGMTGLWQVSGKNNLTFKEMIRLDIMYSKKMNLWLDLRILFQTFPTIFSSILDHIVFAPIQKRTASKAMSILQFKKFIRRNYSDIYNVDKLEFLDEKVKDNQLDLMELMLLLAKLNKISPNYKTSKRYYGILKLIDFEKRSQLKEIKDQLHS